MYTRILIYMCRRKQKGGQVSADKKKMGRPYRNGVPRDERVVLRLTKEEKEEILKKSLEKGMSMTELIIKAVNEYK